MIKEIKEGSPPSLQEAIKLKNILNAIRLDLINEIESKSLKNATVKRETLRKYRAKVKKFEKLVREQKADPEELTRAEQKYNNLFIKKKCIDQESTDNEVKEYHNKNPEVEVIEEYIQPAEFIKNILIEYIESLSNQAKSQKKLGIFFKKNGFEKYIVPSTGNFRVKDIQVDSKISSRTIKRFCHGFKALIRNYL